MYAAKICKKVVGKHFDRKRERAEQEQMDGVFGDPLWKKNICCEKCGKLALI